MDEAIVPEIYDPSKIDIQEMVSSEEAIDMARQIIKKEGIFVGMSYGAAMLAALRTAESAPKGSNIVVVFPDRAEKYLSTIMFDPYKESSKLPNSVIRLCLGRLRLGAKAVCYRFLPKMEP